MAVYLNITDRKCHVQCWTVLIYRHRTLHHSTQHGLQESKNLTNNSFLGWHSGWIVVWAGGLLVTFEQPFRLPRAEHAQGVPQDLNPHLNKAQLAISRPIRFIYLFIFLQRPTRLQLSKRINGGQHFFAGTVALIRGRKSSLQGVIPYESPPRNLSYYPPRYACLPHYCFLPIKRCEIRL